MTSPPNFIVELPRAVAGEENGVLVLRREHFARVEPQAEAGRVRACQHDRRREFTARVTPAEFRIERLP